MGSFNYAEKQFDENLNQIQTFFEVQLTKLNLDKSQIETQTLEQLEMSLETINGAIQHPEQFGVLKLKITAEARIFISQANSDFHYEIGILPVLLEKKKRILERITILKGGQKIKNLHDLIKSVVDLNTRDQLEKQLNILETTAKELDKKLEETRQLQESQLLKVQLEYIERTAKIIEAMKLQNPESQDLNQQIAKIQENLQRTIQERDRYNQLSKLLGAFIIIVVGLYTIFILPDVVSWTWLSQHPRKLGLQMSGILILVGVSWSILDKNKSRQSIMITSIVLATIVGMIQLL